jgi:putative DNA primase/helicase
VSTPYKAWAPHYLRLGWSPIPLNLRSKDPVPEGFTGASGRYVTAEDVRGWCAPRAVVHVGKLAYPPGNVALRLPKDVIGIDVDAHSGKAGKATFERALKEWGPLPATWKSSSRAGSPLSGIYLFRVPEGLKWPGNFGKAAKTWGTDDSATVTGGVDLIRWDHRYIVVGPSQHDKAPHKEYFWTSPTGNVTRLPWRPEDTEALGPDDDFELPSPDELPDMPERWVTGLTGGEQWASSGSTGGRDLTQAEIRAWAAERDSRSGVERYAGGMCPGMENVLRRHLQIIRNAGDDGGCHDATRDAIWAVMGDSASGHYGVGKAINQIKGAFLEAVKGRRSSVRQATQEFWRFLRDGVAKISNEHTDEDGATDYEDQDQCSQLATAGNGERKKGGIDEGVGRKGKGSSAYDFERNDKGNAQRLRRHLGGDELDALWCGPNGGWHLWDPETGLWMLDPESIRMRAEAMDMVTEMRKEIAYLDDGSPDGKGEAAAFAKHVSQSSNRSKLDPAIDLMKSLKGVNTDPEKFNADRRVLHCANGVVMLTNDGVEFRGHSREDYATLSTRVPYLPEAENDAWEKFLDKFIPDEEDRLWTQKLTGYSLLGGNPQRILVLCKGKTSTGKTTFSEAIRMALGAYAGPLPLSALRDHQDEKPRPDLLAVFPRRLAAADEVSEAWELHADQVKRITGGGVATARGMFGKAYQDVVPLFTPWIATNNTPRIKGVDEATRVRLRVIPWLVQLPVAEQSGRAKEALATPEAKAAVLAWAIKGWEAYLEDETLSDVPPHALHAVAEVTQELDELDDFIKDVCASGPAHETWASASVLYQEYKDWCEENGISGRDVMTSNKFGRQLTNNNYERDQKRDPDTGKTIKIRRGLRLKSSEERDAKL